MGLESTSLFVLHLTIIVIASKVTQRTLESTEERIKSYCILVMAAERKGRVRIEDKLKRYEKIDFLGEGQVRCLPKWYQGEASRYHMINNCF